MNLITVKERIKTEKRYGDIERACATVGVTATVMHTALRKNRFDDLTVMELHTIRAMVALLNERLRFKKEIAESQPGTLE